MTESAILANYPGASRWQFGDSPALADETVATGARRRQNRNLWFLCRLSTREITDGWGL